MRRIAIALLASTVIATSAFAASNNQQQPQTKQMQPQNQNQTQGSALNQSAQNQQQNANQTAQNNAPIPPRNLSRGEVRQVQQALDKHGFKAGPTDGRWGRETASAVKQFSRVSRSRRTGSSRNRPLPTWA